MHQNAQRKVIGTLVPLSALSSLKSKDEDQGTFEAGVHFLDWLHKTSQNAWQMLPLHQTQLEKNSKSIRVPSPYKGYGIGLDPRYLSSRAKAKLPKNESEINRFIQKNADWIQDYALFCALTDLFGTDDWRNWDSGLRKRKKESVNKYIKKLKKEIDNHILIQWQLHVSYNELKNKAKALNILLIGDLPFYVSVKSPLVWAHQGIFQFERDCSLRYVSGIPDTPSAHFGRQTWGHPLYKWKSESMGLVISFWKIRIKYLSQLFDSIRFDHAKGLFDYGVIDLKNTKKDRYISGPGYRTFEELMKFGKKCGLSIFAEDSGENLSELRISLKKLKTPGIKIFRFALNEKKKKLNKEYADITNYPTNTVVYTTTHDTESLILYLSILNTSQKKQLAMFADVEYLSDNYKFAKLLRNAILKSKADTVIIPIQDWLLIIDRINIPGTEKEIGDNNWKYKLSVPIEELVII